MRESIVTGSNSNVLPQQRFSIVDIRRLLATYNYNHLICLSSIKCKTSTLTMWKFAKAVRERDEDGLTESSLDIFKSTQSNKRGFSIMEDKIR